MQIFTLKILLFHLSYWDNKIKFNVVLKQTSINNDIIHTWSKRILKDTWTVKGIEHSSYVTAAISNSTSIELQV